MRISELIGILEKAKLDYGDIAITIESTRSGERLPIKDICVEQVLANPYIDGETWYKRIVII